MQAKSEARCAPTLVEDGIKSMRKGDLDAAVAIFKRAVSLDPSFAPSLVQTGLGPRPPTKD